MPPPGTCIRRHYVEENSPLASTMVRYAPFFHEFGSFDAYVSLFLLEDLVDEEGGVRFFLPFDGFIRPAPPQSMDEYQQFRERQLRFVRARNAGMLAALEAT